MIILPGCLCSCRFSHSKAFCFILLNSLLPINDTSERTPCQHQTLYDEEATLSIQAPTYTRHRGHQHIIEIDVCSCVTVIIISL